MPERNNEYVYQPPAKFTEELRQRINNAGFSDGFKQQIKSAQKEEGRKMFERSYEIIKAFAANLIESMKSELEQLQELAKANAEGRLVVLPVKVGDTAYRIISHKCIAVCNKLNACNSFVYKACKQAEFYVCPGTFQLKDMGWIGKTVFLTREEAEKALGVGE